MWRCSFKHNIINSLKKGDIPYFGVNGNHDSDYIPEYANAHLEVRKANNIKIGGFEGS